MNKHFRVNQVFQTFLMIGILIHFSQSVLAHTLFDIPRLPELKKVTNHITIGHGCQGNTVIGTSVVFPDGQDSIITINDNAHSGTLDEFVSNWGGIFQLLQDRSVFAEQDVKQDGNGNTTGFWSGGGRGMAANLNAQIPFTMSAVLLNSESCAKSVRFAVAVVDICTITTFADFADDTVGLWVPAVGSQFDGKPGGHAYDSPAYLTIVRDLEGNPLPETCGEGIEEVLVKPSAAQINRDMPIRFNGQQVWPQN